MDIENYVMEFIGSRIFVKKHDNRLYENIEGEVVDETFHTFIVEVKGKQKIIPKDHAIFKFSRDGKTFEVEGALIDMRPEDRLKNIRKFRIIEERGKNNGSKHWN